MNNIHNSIPYSSKSMILIHFGKFVSANLPLDKIIEAKDNFQ
jgi:hypothetical protein